MPSNRPETIERLQIDGPAGPLEALLEIPAQPRAVGVVCHPHPQFGGTMDNKVAHTLGRSFVALGVAIVRFNFRGVGASGGSYDEGRGEQADAAAVADWLMQRLPGLPLWLGGFSFGALVALRLAAERETAQLVTIAPAVDRLSERPVRRPDCPWLIVQGDADELVSSDAVLAFAQALSPRPDVVVLDGVDHFFHGRLTELRETLLRRLGTG